MSAWFLDSELSTCLNSYEITDLQNVIDFVIHDRFCKNLLCMHSNGLLAEFL